MHQGAILLKCWPFAPSPGRPALPGCRMQLHGPQAACRIHRSINQRAIFLACVPKYDSWPDTTVSLHFLADSGTLCKLLSLESENAFLKPSHPPFDYTRIASHWPNTEHLSGPQREVLHRKTLKKVGYCVVGLPVIKLSNSL